MAGAATMVAGPARPVGNLSLEFFSMRAKLRPEFAERMKPVGERLGIIAPLLENQRVHMPFWAVNATRVD
jgi:hypothetical protein